MKIKYVEKWTGCYDVYDNEQWIGTVEHLDARHDNALRAAGMRGEVWKAESTYGDRPYFATTRKLATDLVVNFPDEQDDEQATAAEQTT